MSEDQKDVSNAGQGNSGDYMIPKEAITIQECARCGCRVFQSTVNLLIIDAEKSNEMGFTVPSNGDPANNGNLRFVQQDTGIFVCAGCGKKYRSEQIIADYVSFSSRKEAQSAKTENAAESTTETNPEPEQQ